MHTRRLFAFLSLAALVLPPARAGSAPTAARVTLQTGEIAGAKFSIAIPAGAWNRRLLLLAHGFVPETAPLHVELNPDDRAHRALLDERWMIAATSFRRNGVILAEAIADLDALRTWIAKEYGEPERTLIEGDSMGGLIVTLIAERETEPRLYDGALAVGAALHVKESNSTLGLNAQPRIPLVFLSNRSEAEGPRLYTEPLLRVDEGIVRPVLFRVARDGHVNVNQHERLAARRALDRWLDRGREALPRPPPGSPFVDLTVEPTAQPSRVQLHADGRGFEARVTAIVGAQGNIVLDAQPADFAAIGLTRGARFPFTAHATTYRATLGREFAHVPRGDWIVFPDAEGFTILARNFASAASTARLAAGDVVTIRRFDEPP